MSRFYIITLFLALFIVSCDNEDYASEIVPSGDVFTIEEVNAKINNQLSSTQEVFNWDYAPEDLLWSAIVHGKNTVEISYGIYDESFTDGNKKEFQQAKNKIIEILNTTENQKETPLVIQEDDHVFTFTAKIFNRESLSKLKQMKEVKNLFPSNYIPLYFGEDTDLYDKEFTSPPIEQKSGGDLLNLFQFGCGVENDEILNEDYTLDANNNKIAWNYSLHQIPEAWEQSTGEGVAVGVIDTGLNLNNAQMSTLFNATNPNRTVNSYGTYVSHWWPVWMYWLWYPGTDGPQDRCGHGTAMAGNIAAPKSNDNTFMGVAHNSNLVTYRAASDVVLTGAKEFRGVTNAIYNLASSNVKIMSMSMGTIFYVPRINIAIAYATWIKRSLIFCAAGTTTNFTNWIGVIFPANLPATVAVTGVKAQERYQQCYDCHSGLMVDFTIQMERPESFNRTTPIIGYYNDTNDYVGGSSIATSTLAGIAALVKSEHPSYGRYEILQALKEASDFYPNRDLRFGWGNVNALEAVNN